MVESKKQQLMKWIDSTTKQFKKDDFDGWRWMELPKNKIVLIQWENGFDPKSKDGIHSKSDPNYCLEISVREDKGAYMECDNPIVESWQLVEGRKELKANVDFISKVLNRKEV